jgi:hypothetical protein
MRNEELMNKWKPILEHTALPGIQDSHKAAVTATLLENTETAIKEGSSYTSGTLLEAAPTNNTADSAGANGNYDPVLISLVRRAMPNLVAYDIAGVQPMTGPTGLIFAMHSKYATTRGDSTAGDQAFISGADPKFSGDSTAGTGMTTAAGEALGVGLAEGTPNTPANPIPEMSFEIDKVSVTATSRALKAEYSSELAQDLKAIHGLDAETELANMLSAELLAEINREVVGAVKTSAKIGAQAGSGTATAGTFNLDVDANGRWSVEKFKGLMFFIEREANKIALDTRRGKGNLILCSSDVASALQMAGVLDYTPAIDSALNVDATGNTFAGVLNGRYKVYVDPYAGSEFLVVGYKGTSAFDAGIFYCPYVPLQMVRAVGENSFQSKIGFKTRYGIVANPFANRLTNFNGEVGSDQNVYYRNTAITNLL